MHGKIDTDMTGRDKIEAAFSVDGTPQIPAVICCEDIYIRDHWARLSPSNPALAAA